MQVPYYVEQAAGLPGLVGAHRLTRRDALVLGPFKDSENYDIGFVAVTSYD